MTLAIILGCDTDFTQIHCAVTAALKRVFTVSLLASGDSSSIISQAVTERKQQQQNQQQNSNKNTSYSGSQPLNSMLDSVGSLLQLKYQNAWIYILDGIFASYNINLGIVLILNFNFQLLSFYSTRCG